MGRAGNVIWLLVLGLGVNEAKAAASLTVLLYDYVNVPGAMLADAEAFAARSYRAAGIELAWVECTSSTADVERFHACEEANDGHRPVLKIISEKMSIGLRWCNASEDVLGVALVSSAYVVYSRVHQRAEEWRVPEQLILGRTMAHELGHLLLGENSHSRSGLMKASFARQDLALETGQFCFEPKQAARLRALFTHRPE